MKKWNHSKLIKRIFLYKLKNEVESYIFKISSNNLQKVVLTPPMLSSAKLSGVTLI